MPFLDHRFVGAGDEHSERAARPRNGTLKYLLKKAVRGLVPDELIDSPQAGLRRAGRRALSTGACQRHAESELRRFCAETDLLDRAKSSRVMQTADGAKRWYLLNLAMWWRTFIAKDVPAPPVAALA